MKRFGLLVVCAALAGACSKSNTSSPTTPSPTVTTDTFTGTVAVHGADSHTFAVPQEGTVSATLTASPVVMGLGIGREAGSACAPLPGASTQTAAGSSPQVSGVMTQGTYCVQVYDVGNATGPVAYTVTVTHP